MTNLPKLIKGLDYVINVDGNLVFTAHYHKKRGYCCQSACLNCPYGYGENVDPNVPAEYNDAWEASQDVDAENQENDD